MPDSREVSLTAREQDDLELLLAGALSPLHGFDAESSGVTLVVPESGHRLAPGDTVRLLDEEGAPLADLDVTATFPAAEGTGLVGPVRAVCRRAPRPFERYYRPPLDRPAGDAVPLVVPTDRFLTQGDLDHLADAGQPVVLLALVGQGTPIGTSAPDLIRSCLEAAQTLASVEVIAVPLARRDQTPSGRAPRDPTLDEELRRRVVARYSRAVATDSGAFAGAAIPGVWWPTHQGPPATVPGGPHGITGEPDAAPRYPRGIVLLFTGLSGSGKSTIARGVRNALIEQGQRTVSLLDGDEVRRNLSSGLGFSPADRETNVRRIGWVAAEIARHGGVAIASPIAPFASTRAAVRDMALAAGADFLLVHVATPLAECERRDRKGLYARARRGEVAEFTGISSPYEEPDDADLSIDTTTCTPDEAAARVLAELHLPAEK